MSNPIHFALFHTIPESSVSYSHLLCDDIKQYVTIQPCNKILTFQILLNKNLRVSIQVCTWLGFTSGGLTDHHQICHCGVSGYEANSAAKKNLYRLYKNNITTKNNLISNVMNNVYSLWSRVFFSYIIQCFNCIVNSNNF